MTKKVLVAVKDVLLSPRARRYEIGLAILIYEGIKAALGHP